MLVALEAASIDTQIVDEPAKSLWRRLPFLLCTVYRAHEPPGPWHVVVPSERLNEAQRLLGMGLEGRRESPSNKHVNLMRPKRVVDSVEVAHRLCARR